MGGFNHVSTMLAAVLKRSPTIRDQSWKSLPSPLTWFAALEGTKPDHRAVKTFSEACEGS